MKRLQWVLAVVVFAGVGLGRLDTARACGCFTPPDPATPVLQSGERIVFAVWGNQVTAHIQIQYTGDAKEFGWLLPLPSVPTLELGTDELFQTLTQQTAPTYVAKRVYPDKSCNPNMGQFGAAGEAADMGAVPAPGGNNPSNPLVVQDSIGPYDYAVLKADSKADMLAWLATNRYFVPAGTDDVIQQYLHPGSFFLALKLRSGQSSGDIQPVVVHYPSDLPMIPIVLTSATAQANMGVWVWLLGEGRAIPRNYYHAVLNDAAMDWSDGYGGYGPYGGYGGGPGGPGFGNGGPNSRQIAPAAVGIQNYSQVVARAVAEAPNHHAFVTEFAGPSKVMKDVLAPPARFGDLDALRKLSEVSAYLGFLRAQNFTIAGTLLSILRKSIPVPPLVTSQGISDANFYYNFDFYYSGPWHQRNPTAFAGITYKIDPVAMTNDIEMRVVKPVRDAQALFDTFPYLTRLYTVLSPADMTRDPVFSFNPFLPDVSNQHAGTINYRCAATQPQPWQNQYDGTVATEQGWTMDYPLGNYPTPAPDMPSTLRLEILRDSGLPEVVTDNRAPIALALHQASSGGGASKNPQSSFNESGCAVGDGTGARRSRAPLAGLALVGAALLLLARRRARR